MSKCILMHERSHSPLAPAALSQYNPCLSRSRITCKRLNVSLASNRAFCARAAWAALECHFEGTARVARLGAPLIDIDSVSRSRGALVPRSTCSLLVSQPCRALTVRCELEPAITTTQAHNTQHTDEPHAGFSPIMSPMDI